MPNFYPVFKGACFPHTLTLCPMEWKVNAAYTTAKGNDKTDQKDDCSGLMLPTTI